MHQHDILKTYYLMLMRTTRFYRQRLDEDQGIGMLQLVYTSVASPSWDGNIEALCAKGAINNKLQEVTGAILYEDGFFMHVLEGPRAAVEDTFLRVVVDPRHHSLLVFSRKAIVHREFGYDAMSPLEHKKGEDSEMTRKIRSIVGLSGMNAVEYFEKRFG